MNDNLEYMKSVATKHQVDLLETSNGAFIVELPGIRTLAPLLISADEGETWCPEAMCKENGISWSGKTCMRGLELEDEIKKMYRTLAMGPPTLMLSIAHDLTDDLTKHSGKLFC